jgi:hypothetical protein
MKNNLIKLALGMVLAVSSANADYVRPLTNGLTFTNGYYFQHVSKIAGNLTAQSGPFQNKITVINQDQTWSADTVYVLDNLTFVEAPAVLTIQPGTIIRGAPELYKGSSTLDPTIVGDLNICRGAKIIAKGTAENPIVMTSLYDPLVRGGVNTIPHSYVNTNGVITTIADATITTEANKYIGVDSTSSQASKAHAIDAQWGSLTLLGRAPVGFGGPTGSAGNLQIGITTNNQSSQSFVRNPTFTFSPSTYKSGSSDTNSPTGSGFNLEALFNPVGVARLTNGTPGTFTKFPGASLKATVADGSRTASRTTLNNIPVYVTNTANGTDRTANYTVGQTLNTGDTVVVDWNAATFASRGLQYNVPKKKDAAPFLATYGYSDKEIALELTNSSVFSASGVPTSLTNVASAYPTAELVLSNTYLYGVIVKAPNAYGSLSSNAIATNGLSISGSTSGTNPVAVVSITPTAISEPSAIPLKGGIGANFVEGKQAIDGGAYGFSNNPSVDADGAAWTTFSGGIFGGNNSADNSGIVSMVQLRHGGRVLSPNNEINGLTLGGVGSATVIDYVEVIFNADDGYEMFGGTVNLRHCADIYGGDDTFDTDMSYVGNGQYLFALQNNTVGSDASKKTSRPYGNVGDNLGENDGNEDPNYIANSTYPGTQFTYFNTTMVGIGYMKPSAESFASDRQGPNFKDNSGGKVFNSLYLQAPAGAMCDQSTSATSDNPLGVGARMIVNNPQSSPVRTAAGVAIDEPQGVLAYNTWSQCGGGSANTTANYTNLASLFPTASGRSSSGGSKVNDSIAVTKVTNADLQNRFLGTEVINSLGSNGRLEGVDPTLPTNSAERTNGTNPRASAVVAPGASTGLSSSVADRGSFFAPISFRGAFDRFNWMKGWTHADEIGVFAGNQVVVPNVTLKRSGAGNVVASFNTETGVQYVVEVSSDNKTFNPLNQVIVGNNNYKDIDLGQSGLLFVRVTPQ